MSGLRRRARAALSARLRAQVGLQGLHPDGVHALRFADALVTSVGRDDAGWAHAQLARRAKGELRPTRSGAVPAHAAWSSAALVCSAFAPWRADPTTLPLAGLEGFCDVRVEERLLIPHGGGTPNLDVALSFAGGLVGVESKLTEHLAPRPVRPWPAAYRRPSMAAELEGGWAETFAALLERRYTPRFLDVPQLVRHALSLRRVTAPQTHLALLFWEPADGDDHSEIRAHRDEVAELLERVGPDMSPRLHAVSYAVLLEQWAPVRPRHVAALRARYEVAIGSGDP